MDNVTGISSIPATQPGASQVIFFLVKAFLVGLATQIANHGLGVAIQTIRGWSAEL